MTKKLILMTTHFENIFKKDNFMFKITLAKVIVSCLIYSLAGALVQKIWR